MKWTVRVKAPTIKDLFLMNTICHDATSDVEKLNAGCALIKRHTSLDDDAIGELSVEDFTSALKAVCESLAGEMKSVENPATSPSEAIIRIIEGRVARREVSQ